MLLKNRIKFFNLLGRHLKSLQSDVFEELIVSAKNENAWFTLESIKYAIEGISMFLEEEKLLKWTSGYDLKNMKSKKVGVIVAGNIPLAGFHDVLSVLISGHDLMLKMSSEDRVLMTYVLDYLCKLDSSFTDSFTSVGRLNGAEVYIATGSDNTARYFQYYFNKKQNLIRKNRTSIAVITGEETKEQLEDLGQDVFQYYGLGCRNVSKIFVPKGYKLPLLLDGFQSFESVINHHKYQNNYDYNKSIYLVNKEPHLDNGFLLLKASEELVSPISVLYYQEYDNDEHLTTLLDDSATKIQCVIGVKAGQIDFGTAQNPELWDYADGVDTLAFLTQV